MNKAERAIKACREAADALERLPPLFRFKPNLFLGPPNSPVNLRLEADYIERMESSLRESIEEVTDG